jgi:tetratricopeptide (TPR) repeat protein
VADDLSEAETAPLREHLSHCPSCARQATAYESVAAFLRERPSAVPRKGLEDRLRVRLAEVKLQQPASRQLRRKIPRLALRLAGYAVGAAAVLALAVYGVRRHPAEPEARLRVASGPQATSVRAAQPPLSGAHRQSATTRAPRVAVPERRPAAVLALAPRSDYHQPKATAAPEPVRPERPRGIPPDGRSPAPPPGATLRMARILSVRGAPMVLGLGAKKPWLASSGSPLRAGEGLHGGEMDRALIRWDDTSQVATAYDTTVTLLNGAGADPVRLSLKKGQLWVWAPGDAHGVEIDTPAGLALIERGEAVVSARPSGGAAPGITTTIAAFSGQSMLLTPTGKTTIKPGQGLIVPGKETAADPRRIPVPDVLRRGLLWGSEYHIWRAWGLRRDEVLSLLAAPRVELGVRPEPLAAPDGSPVVYRVGVGTPAARAGLQPGDIVRSLDGQPLHSPLDLAVWELRQTGRCLARAAVRRGPETLSIDLDCSPHPPALPWPAKVAPLLRASVISLTAADFARAKAWLRQAANQDGQCAAAYYNLGLLYEHEGRWPETVTAYQRAAAMAPDSALVHLAHGRGLLGIANLDGAARELRRALKLDPNLLPARYLLGRALLLGGDPTAAAAEARQLLAEPDGGVLGEVLLGDIAAVGGQHEAAVAHFRRALRADRYELEAKVQLALELDAAGRGDEAESEARELLTWEPSSARAANLIGAIHLRARDFPVAEQWLQRARTLRPDVPDAPSNLGLLYFYTRHYAESQASYQEALRLTGVTPAAHIGLAMLLQATGRDREAEQQYVQALELDPANGQALTKLVALCRGTGQDAKAAVLLVRYDLRRS